MVLVSKDLTVFTERRVYAISRFSEQDKSFALKNGIYARYSQLHKRIFNGDETAREEFFNEYDQYWYDLCRSIAVSKCRQKRSIEQRFEKVVLKGQAVFVTLTFKPSVLESTSEETRAKYVKRFLKECCVSYVANVDYGDENEREHYHGLVMPLDGLKSLKEWSYGWYKFKKVGTSDKDRLKVSKYVAKLSNHALKNKGWKPRIIYSRGWKHSLYSFYDDNLIRLPF